MKGKNEAPWIYYEYATGLISITYYGWHPAIALIVVGFTRVLDYVYDFYQFRGRERRTAVTAALAVPTAQLRPMLTDSQVVYGVGVSVILVDTLEQSVSRMDTTLYFTSARLADADAFMRVYVDLELEPAERVVYRLVVRDAFDPRTGALYGGPIPLRNFRADRIEVSDVVLTRPDAGQWTRSGLTFALTPAQSFRIGEPITIFYEIYNLPGDTPYRTEIRVVPAMRGLVDRLADLVTPGSRSLRVSFEGATPVAGGPVREVRTLQGGLRPDDYEIEVTVTDLLTGARATASSLMTLVEVE